MRTPYEQSNFEKILAAKVLARLTAFVVEADEYGLQMIDAALRIHRIGFEGTGYPDTVSTIEEFIGDLINKYEHKGLSTPEGVEELLPKFRGDFSVAVSTARRLAARGVVLNRAATV